MEFGWKDKLGCGWKDKLGCGWKDKWNLDGRINGIWMEG